MRGGGRGQPPEDAASTLFSSFLEPLLGVRPMKDIGDTAVKRQGRPLSWGFTLY